MSTIYKTSFLVLLLIFVGFSSCVVNHIGNAGQNIPPLGTNYKILGVAQGRASSTRFLGIETKNRNALTSEAMQKMILRYPLSKGQTYGFLNVDSRNSSFFLFNETTITVTSFLIEASDSMTTDKELVQVFNTQNKYDDFDRFPIGSRVYFIENERIIEGLIKQYDFSGKASVIYVSGTGKQEKVISLDDLSPTTAISDAFLKKKEMAKIRMAQDSILKLEEKLFLENKLKEQQIITRDNKFNVGDKVYFQTAKGKTLGEVTKIEGDNIFIRYMESKSVSREVLILRSKVVLAKE
jgi:hypothetical protein